MIRLALTTVLVLCFSAAHADPKEEARALSREAFKIEREMGKLIPDIEGRDPKLKALYEESVKAGRAVEETLKTHPALAGARAKRDAAFNEVTLAIGKGDAAGKEAAQNAYADAENNIRAEGRKVPEIQQMMDAAANVGSAYIEKKQAVFAAQPETAEMAKKVAELRAKSAELRRAAR